MSVIVHPPKRFIEGVKPAVAEKIAKTLEAGRRYFGSSGASLTHQVFNPAYTSKGLDTGAAKIGLEGERSTTKFLKDWIKDKPNAVLVDSVHIRGWGKEEVDEETGLIEGGDTDHVLIIGSEVILIDTKRWKKKSNYTVADDGKVLRANKNFAGGAVNATAALHLWLDYLHHSAKLTSMVVINAEDSVVFRNRNWYQQKYRLVEMDRFKELLDLKYEKIDEEDKNSINSTLVSQVVVGAVKPYNEYHRVFSEDTLRSFH